MTSSADNLIADGQVTLREAIQAANTDTSVDGSATGHGADTITFAASLSGATIRLSGSELLISSQLTINAAGLGRFTVDAQNLSRVFHVAQGGNAEIDSLRITGGNAPFSGPDDNFSGGGVLNQRVLSLQFCEISANSGGFGGGIGNYSATLNLLDVTVVGNSGGIQNDTGTVTINSSTIEGSTEGNSFFNNGGTVKISNTTISGDQGGIVNAGGDMQFTDCIFSGSGDDATAYHGVGGSATLTHCTLTNARAAFGGNLIRCLGGSFTILDSSFEGNSGTMLVGQAATFSIARTLFANNGAGDVLIDASVRNDRKITSSE